MNGIPDKYDINFIGDIPFLTERGIGRLLEQFRPNGQVVPVLGTILIYLLREVQELSSDIIWTLQGRTLSQAQTDQLDIIGRIVGLKRNIILDGIFPLWTQDGQNIITQDGQNIDVIEAVSDRGNDEYRQLLLLKIICNNMKYCSVPELTAAIFETSGIEVIIERIGPMQVSVIVPPGTEVTNIDAQNNTFEVDGKFLFPWPATLEVIVGYSDNILTQAGDNILTQTGDEIVTQLTKV